MSDTNPQESMEAEGIPDVEQHPPGMDVELDEESMMAPREYPVASGLDSAYAVTAAEERQPESLADRAAREIPDVGADELGVGGGIAGSEYPEFETGSEDYVVGAFSAGTEAGAVPVDEPLPPSLEDEVAVTALHRPEAALSEPSSAEGAYSDGEADEGVLADQDIDVALSGEESAVHVVSDEHVR